MRMRRISQVCIQLERLHEHNAVADAQRTQDAQNVHLEWHAHAPGRRPASESTLLPPNGDPKMSTATPRAATPPALACIASRDALTPPSQSLDNTDAAAKVVGLHSRGPAPADKGEERGTRVAPSSWVPAASLVSYSCECLARSAVLSRQRRTRSSRSRQSSCGTRACRNTPLSFRTLQVRGSVSPPRVLAPELPSSASPALAPSMPPGLKE